MNYVLPLNERQKHVLMKKLVKRNDNELELQHWYTVSRVADAGASGGNVICSSLFLIRQRRNAKRKRRRLHVLNERLVTLSIPPAL